MNTIQIIALALVGLGLALIVAFVLTADRIDEVEGSDLRVDWNGKLIEGSMIRYYELVVNEMECGNTKRDCERVSLMLEHFKDVWGMNEWYNELYADFLMMDMSIVE